MVAGVDPKTPNPKHGACRVLGQGNLCRSKRLSDVPLGKG